MRNDLVSGFVPDPPAKVQQELPRLSAITVGITRLINTAQYENIQIKLETTDQIAWSTPTERAKKVDNLVKVLNDQYKDTEMKVLTELGLPIKRAFAKAAARPAATTIGDELLTGKP